jgi:hypothetical protein
MKRILNVAALCAVAFSGVLSISGSPALAAGPAVKGSCCKHAPPGNCCSACPSCCTKHTCTKSCCDLSACASRPNCCH